MDNYVNVEELLAEGKVIRKKIKGYSMYPVLLPDSDEVLIQKVNPATLKRGDVILYRREQSILVLHRIWKRKGDKFYTVGDNQSKIEGPLDVGQIKGKMIGFIRKGKHISTDGCFYRLYSGVWLCLRPVRPYLSKAVHEVKIIYNRLRGR